VVILGARGFVAPALAASLAADGIDVVAVGSASIDLLDPTSVERLGDVLEEGDALVMTSALTPEKGRDVGTLIRNLRMAEHVAAAVAKHPLAQLIYFSSDAVYSGPAPFYSEATPPSPSDLYGLMHRARELAFLESTVKVGIPFCALRPCAIYGPGDTHNSYGPNRFIRTALKDGKIRLFGLGEETRDHVYIGDVVNLTKMAIGHCSSGVLNLVSGHVITFRDLAKKIAEMTGGTSTIESLPTSSAVTHRQFDPGAIRMSFPGHTSTRLEDGLRHTISAFSDG
jgi:UDP-glucose 4-epimerase